jgi:acyl carrier protein
LLQSGTLTSLQTIGLVQFIQTEFGVEIEPEEISEREFKSLRTISALVTRKLQVARGAVA